MSKTKHNPPRNKEPNFIKFSQVQRGYLNEVRVRQIKEWNDALESVYEDLGIIEKLAQAPPGTYKLRQNDLSGLDVLPIKLEIKKELEPEKKTESQEGPEPQGKSEKKGGKDN